MSGDDSIEEKSWTQQDFGLDRRLIKVKTVISTIVILYYIVAILLGTFQTWICKANAGPSEMYSDCFAGKRSSGRNNHLRAADYLLSYCMFSLRFVQGRVRERQLPFLYLYYRRFCRLK